MKQGKRPTRKQKEVISAAGLDVDMWLVSKAEAFALLLIHRYTGRARQVFL